MKVAVLGGGGCFALNFARLCNERGIDHFGIGRSKKFPPFWEIEHHYRYWKLHLVTELPAIMAVLDTERPDAIVNFAALKGRALHPSVKTRLTSSARTLGRYLGWCLNCERENI